MIIEGVAFSAELCLPIKNLVVVVKNKLGNVLNKKLFSNGKWQVDAYDSSVTIYFSAEGFCEKSYKLHELPEMIRLLESKIIGYQEKLWYKPGEQVNVFVHSVDSYSVTLYRHGLLKQEILTLQNYEAQIQKVQDEHFVENGLTWARSFTYTIPEQAKPGIYSLLLESKGQEKFAIPMLVSSVNLTKSKVLVLASTNTWQSYNIWGGRSRYRNNENNQSVDFISKKQLFTIRLSEFVANYIPEFGIEIIKKILKFKQPAWKFKKLTIMRPYTNCLLDGSDVYQPFTNHLASSEWRLLAWLEREGIDYDLISGFELHHNPDILKQYRALIFSTHCEYWTKEMFDTVVEHHSHHNLWILNVSGNTMYREIEFHSDGSTRCISLSFKQSYSDESQITGVRFSMSDYGTCSPYKILMPEHWAFDGIPINSDYPFFGEKSLLQNTRTSSQYYDPGRPGVEAGLSGSGASGWETDKLTKTAPKDCFVIAKGQNKGGGADMVIREPEGLRGGMFSASSITFASSLLIDYTASELLKNIIKKVYE